MLTRDAMWRTRSCAPCSRFHLRIPDCGSVPGVPDLGTRLVAGRENAFT
jgi:hypothetical protein